MKERIKQLDIHLAKMNEADRELAAKIAGREESRAAVVDRQATVTAATSEALARLTAEQKGEQQAMASRHTAGYRDLTSKADRQREALEVELTTFDSKTATLQERRKANKADYDHVHEARGLLVKAADELAGAREAPSEGE